MSSKRQRFNANEQARLVENAMFLQRDLLARLIDPKRDIDAECGYPPEVTREQFRALYKRGDIAARIVDIYPEESWKHDPEVIETEDGDDSPWEKAWKELVTQHNIYGTLLAADKLSGVGRFGILLIGIDDGKPLSEPVDGVDERNPQSRSSAQRKIIYLRTFDETEVDIADYEKDVTSPRYSQPTRYNIRIQDVRNGQPADPTTLVGVHWTRVIHIADTWFQPSSSLVFAEPRMQVVFNRVYDTRKLLGGSAEMFWKGGFPGLSLELNPDIKQAGLPVTLDKEGMRKQVEAYQNSLQRYLLLTGVTARTLNPQVADPDKHFEIAVKAICIAIGCPYRVFMGTEESRLAGAQDSEAWNERVNTRQDKYVKPKVILPFVRRLIQMGVLQATKSGKDPLVTFPPLADQGPKEKAEVGEKLTNALSKYVASAVYQLIPFKEYCLHILGMDSEVSEALDKAATSQDDLAGMLREANLPPDDEDDEPASSAGNGTRSGRNGPAARSGGAGRGDGRAAATRTREGPG